MVILKDYVERINSNWLINTRIKFNAFFLKTLKICVNNTYIMHII